MNQREFDVSFKSLRKEQYEYNYSEMPFLSDWRKNPYTFLKARFYMESSAILVYFLLKYKISPNSVTILYALCGLIGGILLAVPTRTTILIALVIFFSKGILDWSDGHVARRMKKTSFTGHILDVYGAHLNEVGFYLGLGFYIVNHSDISFFIYLLPLYPFFISINVVSYSKMIMLNELMEGKKGGVKTRSIVHSVEIKAGRKHVISRQIKSFLHSFLDSRARTIDFICFLIILETLYGFNITYVIYLLLIFKSFLLFIASFVIVSRRSWASNTMESILSNTKSVNNNSH